MRTKVGELLNPPQLNYNEPGTRDRSDTIVVSVKQGCLLAAGLPVFFASQLVFVGDHTVLSRSLRLLQQLLCLRINHAIVLSQSSLMLFVQIG